MVTLTMFERLLNAAFNPTRDPLDSQIAIRVFGYRWVEWNHAFLRGAPLDTPGRFLASPDHALAHLHTDADFGTEAAPDALGLVPRFTSDLDHAFDAAEVTGLFRIGKAFLRRTGDGAWCVESAAGDIRVCGPVLASVICQATLAWLDRSHGGESFEQSRT